MRLLAVILLASAGCAIRYRGPTPVADAPECDAGCRRIYAHCSDDSAKQRQPEPITCREDLSACLQVCEDRVAGDPAARYGGETPPEQSVHAWIELIRGVLR